MNVVGQNARVRPPFIGRKFKLPLFPGETYLDERDGTWFEITAYDEQTEIALGYRYRLTGPEGESFVNAKARGHYEREAEIATLTYFELWCTL